jgi:hypothetical protein
MTETEEFGPFDAFDDCSSMFAFIHFTYGEAGLAELLEAMGSDQESFERYASELEAVGLPNVAAIVLEYAADALPERVLRCPYSPNDRANYECWQASYDRGLLMKSGRILPAPPIKY